MPTKEVTARRQAEEALIARYPEEFSELLRVSMLRHGLETVRIRRVTEKEVSESEALVLQKYGWERV